MQRWVQFCKGFKDLAIGLSLLALVSVIGYAVYCVAPPIGRAIDRSHNADEITCGAKLKSAEYDFTLGFEAKSTNVKNRPTAGTADGHWEKK